MRTTMLAAAFVTMAAAFATACSDSPTTPTSTTEVLETVSAVMPTPAAPVPVPAPVPAPTVAPCSVLQPPAPGSARMLLCVTADAGTVAVSGAAVTYAGSVAGQTDEHGQLLLRLRGYGGTQPLSVAHPDYRTVSITLALREDHVSEHVDLGAK